MKRTIYNSKKKKNNLKKKKFRPLCWLTTNFINFAINMLGS